MSKTKPTISDYDIRVRAYRIWERAGKPEGCAEEHWREALAELEAERRTEAETDEKPSVPAQLKVSSPPVRSAAAEASQPKDEAA